MERGARPRALAARCAVSRRLIVRPDAEAELTAAAAWYEEKRDGLGEQFVTAVETALSAIEDSPETWPYWKREHPYRRYVMRRFPFVVFYTVEPAAVTIVAIAHAKRRPGYWMR
jgi:plasmid stabilization system protein ParE